MVIWSNHPKQENGPDYINFGCQQNLTLQKKNQQSIQSMTNWYIHPLSSNNQIVIFFICKDIVL